MSIEVRGVTKAFGGFCALGDLSLDVPTGKLTALLGPSGSGKTTLLRIIAGLETPDRGEVRCNGEDVTRQQVRDRKVGFVFQHYALFRHMTVFENVAFGLRVRPRRVRPPDAEIRERVEKLLALIQLEWAGHRFPSQLSGGQRQRVALARALAVEPGVLLLDEPFGALDAQVRKELRRWLRRLHDDINLTTVFVTHDQEEALELADRVVIMNRGRIEQEGTPMEVYDRPANAFVYRFLGHVNIFHGRVHDGRASIAQNGGTEAQGEAGAVIFVRPHDIDLEMARDCGTAVAATVRHVTFAGPIVRVELDWQDGAGPVEAELTRERHDALGLKPGDRVFITVRNMQVFTEDYAI